MIANVFKQMLNNHQFQDVNNVVNALRDKGFILADRGRQTTKEVSKIIAVKTITCILPSKIRCRVCIYPGIN